MDANEPLQVHWNGKPGTLGEIIIRGAGRGATVEDLVRETSTIYGCGLSHMTPQMAAKTIRGAIRGLQRNHYGVFENQETGTLWLSCDGETVHVPLDQDAIDALAAEAAKVRRNFNAAAVTDLPPFLCASVESAIQPMQEQYPTVTAQEEETIRATLAGVALTLYEHFARRHED